MPSAWNDSRLAYYGPVPRNPITDPTLFSAHIAHFEAGSNGSHPGTLRQLVTAGPSATQSSGSVTLVKNGTEPAHYLVAATSGYDAPAATSYNLLSQQQTGFGFEWGPEFEVLAIVQAPIGFTDTLYLWQSNNGSSGQVGMWCIIDGANGPIAITAKVTTATADNVEFFRSFNSGAGVYDDPYSILPGVYQVIRIRSQWQVPNTGSNIVAQGYVNGLAGHIGQSNVWTGAPVTSNANHALRFFNDQSGTAGGTGCKVAALLFWPRMLREDEFEAYAAYLCDLLYLPRIARNVTPNSGYSDQPTTAYYPTVGLSVRLWEQHRANVDWGYGGVWQQLSADNWKSATVPELIAGNGASNTGAGFGSPIWSVIDGVTWWPFYTDGVPLVSGAYVSFVKKSLDTPPQTWSTPVSVNGGYGDGQTATEGPVIKASNSHLLLPVYNATGAAKCMDGGTTGASWSVVGTIGANLLECCLAVYGTDIIAACHSIAGGNNFVGLKSTNNGVSFTGSTTIHATADTGRPFVLVLSSGGVAYCFRGTGAEKGRLFLVYCQPADAGAGNYFIVGGIMRPEITFGVYNGCVMREVSVETSLGVFAPALELTHGTELFGPSSTDETQYAEVHAPIIILESALAAY